MQKCFVLIAILITVTLLETGCNFDSSQLLPERTIDRISPSGPNRTISQDFKESVVWRKKDIFIRNFFLPSSELLATSEYVAYINFLGGPLNEINQLELLDPNTGNALWQSERFGDYESFTIVEDTVFVVLNEASFLDIYDVKQHTRPLHSLNNYFEEGAVFHLFSASEDKIYLYYENGGEYFILPLDLHGQQKSEVINLSISQRLSRLFLFETAFFLIANDEYTGKSFTTGEELWRIPATGRIDSWPILHDNNLIISAGDGKVYSIMAVDTKTGRRLWVTEKIFGSNVVLYNGKLYALRNDATLVLLNVRTGQVEEEIPFYPNSIDAGFHAYWLTSNGEKLFVYFGDSQELFALNLP